MGNLCRCLDKQKKLINPFHQHAQQGEINEHKRIQEEEFEDYYASLKSRFLRECEEKRSISSQALVSIGFGDVAKLIVQYCECYAFDLEPIVPHEYLLSIKGVDSQIWQHFHDISNFETYHVGLKLPCNVTARTLAEKLESFLGVPNNSVQLMRGGILLKPYEMVKKSNNELLEFTIREFSEEYSPSTKLLTM